jgi:hypothetical protein
MTGRLLPPRGEFLQNGLIPTDPNSLPEGQRVCIICQEDYINPTEGEEPEPCVKLPCGHTVGDRCIRQWFDTPDPDGWYRRTCPYNCEPFIEQTDSSTGLGAAELRRRENSEIELPLVRRNESIPEDAQRRVREYRSRRREVEAQEDEQFRRLYERNPNYHAILDNLRRVRAALDEYVYAPDMFSPEYRDYHLTDADRRLPPPTANLAAIARGEYGHTHSHDYRTPSSDGHRAFLRRQQYQGRQQSPTSYRSSPSHHDSGTQRGASYRSGSSNVHGFGRGFGPGHETRGFDGQSRHHDSHSERTRNAFQGFGYPIGRMNSERPTYRDHDHYHSSLGSQYTPRERVSFRSRTRADIEADIAQVDAELRYLRSQEGQMVPRRGFSYPHHLGASAGSNPPVRRIPHAEYPSQEDRHRGYRTVTRVPLGYNAASNSRHGERHFGISLTRRDYNGSDRGSDNGSDDGSDHDFDDDSDDNDDDFDLRSRYRNDFDPFHHASASNSRGQPSPSRLYTEQMYREDGTRVYRTVAYYPIRHDRANHGQGHRSSRRGSMGSWRNAYDD